MRSKPVSFFLVLGFVSTLVAPFVVCSEEITKEDIISRYESTYSKFHSCDVTYAAGPVFFWDEWKPKHQQQFRWRKSEKVERWDVNEHLGFTPSLKNKDEKDTEKPGIPTATTIPPMAEYTDGSTLWRFSGDASKAEGIDPIDQKGLHAEIRPVAPENILQGLPYNSFVFSLIINKKSYSIPQILKEFRTEVISNRKVADNTLITTRSYFLDSNDLAAKYFIQISFDSSLNYFPRQIVFPINTSIEEIKAQGNEPVLYAVRNFVEYHCSEDGALFPVKISLSATDDIAKLTNLEVKGKLAVSSITLNQPVEVPSIEFPPGVVVVIEESGTYKSYIWGEDNKPLKRLTSEDYEIAKKEREKKFNLLPKAKMSPIRIVCIAIGLLMIIGALLMKIWERRNENRV